MTLVKKTLFVLCAITAYHCVNAQLTGHNFRKQITINEAQVAGTSDHLNFPMLVSLTDTDLRTTGNGGNVVNTDGYDIAFAASDGTTQLDHEIESYDAATGEFVAWVRIPVLDHNDNTLIYMYYGKTGVTTDPSTTATWNSGYSAVWHLNEDVTDEDDTGIHEDATSNGLDGSQDGNVEAAGIINNAQEFDGTDDHIDFGDPSLSNAVTLSAWVNHDAIAAARNRYISLDDIAVIRHDGANGLGQLHFYIRRGGLINSLRVSGVLSASTWHHVAGIWDGTTQTMILDGVAIDSDTPGGSLDAINSGILSSVTPTETMNGRLDEIHISNVARSVAWITTEYNNQNNPGGFYTPGPEEELDPPLPIELIHFSARVLETEGHILLNWSTASEVNNEVYTLERSTNGTKWSPLLEVPGAGDSDSRLDYEAIDNHPNYGQSYYRLKQTDFDGAYSYSNSLSVTLGNIGLSSRIYPNPANQSITIEGTPDDLMDLSIFNLAGRDVSSGIAITHRSDNWVTLDVSRLPSGIYTVRSGVKSFKMIKTD